MAIHPRVSGTWQTDICPFGDLTWATDFVGGLDTFSWAIPNRGTFPILRRGAPVELMDGGLRLGLGTVTEVVAGQVHGEGLWRMAKGVPALDGSGNPTTVPNTAYDQAIARGDLPGWHARVTFNRATALAGTEPTTAITVAEVLMRDADTLSAVPYLKPTGEVGYRTLPTSPTWQTTPPDGKLTTASDGYATHLVASYYTTAFADATRTYPSTATTAASDTWGKVTRPVDLRGLGIITAGTVDSILAGMLAKGMARPTFADTLEVAYGEITNLGGTPLALNTIEAGQGGRLHGTFDDTRLLGGYQFTDITAGRVEHTDGAATIKIAPVGYTPRDFIGLFAVALEGAA